MPSAVSPTRRRKSFWTLGHREVRTHAILVAVILWIVAAVVTFTGTGYRSVLGPLKGADFVHFYTLGHQAWSGDAAGLYDASAQHRLQASLVPDSAGDFYFPIYPPQAALIFAPFATFSYGWASMLWAATTAALYGVVVWSTYRKCFPDGRDVVLLAAGAAAFAPFWQLVLHGQTTLVPLVAFYLGWRALEHRRPFWSGLALGLLAIKPQFGIALAVVVLAGREWRMLAGAVTSVLLQIACVALILGPGVIRAFAENVRQLPSVGGLLEPKAYQLHSLKALTDLVPGPAGTVVWLIAVAVVLAFMMRAWNGQRPVAVRFGMVVLASVLVNPHLTIYDATVLVLPFLWFGAWFEYTNAPTKTQEGQFWMTVYALYIVFLAPLAFLVRVQPSVVLLLWLFSLVIRATRVTTAQPHMPTVTG